MLVAHLASINAWLFRDSSLRNTRMTINSAPMTPSSFKNSPFRKSIFGRFVVLDLIEYTGTGAQDFSEQVRKGLSGGRAYVGGKLNNNRFCDGVYKNFYGRGTQNGELEKGVVE